MHNYSFGSFKFIESQVHQETLHDWLKTQVEPYDSISVEDFAKSFKNGLALCAVIHRYRPDLIDFFSLSPTDVAKNNQLAFDILEHEFGIPPVRYYISMFDLICLQFFFF